MAQRVRGQVIQPVNADYQESVQRRRAKKQKARIKRLLRFAVVAAILLSVYLLFANWKHFAPDSVVSWVSDVIDGTTGGSWPVTLTGENVFDMSEVGGNLVAVTDTATVYYNSSGGESLSRPCAYAKPMLRVADRYALLLETGGKRFRLETRSDLELEMTVSNTVYTGAVSAKGDVAVVTDSAESYISEVTVYSRKGTKRYQWRSSDWLVMDVSFSQDGNSLAVVGCHAKNGAMESSVLVFDLRGREEQPVQYISGGVMFSRVQYTKSGTIAAIGDSQVRFVNPTGTLDTTVSLEQEEWIGAAFGKKNMMIVTRPYGSQKGGTASIYSVSGDLRTQQAFEGEFRDAAADDDDFFVLTDAYLYEMTASGIADRATTTADSLMVSTVGNRTLILGLTQLGEAAWESKATTTKATEATTSTAATTTTTVTTAASTASTTGA